MKLSSQEEYGLRCLLQLARMPEGSSLTIPSISQAEGLSVPNAAKLMRLLRMGGMVTSERGQSGGYTLARPADQIKVADVIRVLGGQFFTPEFCNRHSGLQQQCAHQSDCSLRVLWTTIQTVLSEVLGRTTLRDLLCNEVQMQEMLQTRTAAAAMFPMQASSGMCKAAAVPAATATAAVAANTQPEP